MKKIYSLVILVLLSFTISWAQTDLNKEIPKDPNVIYGKLENGMTYYIRHNETPKNRAELTVVIHSGSIQEDEDQRGLAHLCEHMAFNGTKNFPKHKLVDFLERTGMKFGADLNAYTSFDETVYGITVPLDSASFLEKGLLVLHDWAHYVTYDDKEIDAERGVVHEEWRMHQGAQFRMQDEMFKAIFKNSKYAERNTIGLMSVVDSCKYDALKRYYRDWYRTDREAIVVVGDFDAKEMETKIKELFGKIPKTENPREYKQDPIPDNDEPIISILKDKENPSTAVQIFYKHDKFYQKTIADYRTSIMHNLYNSMINNRLQELTLTENPPFVYGYAGYGDFIGPKDVYAEMAVTKDDGIINGLETVLTENYRVKQHGFTATELERAKKTVMKQMEKVYNNRDKQKSKNFVNEYKSNFLLAKAPFPGIENEYNYYKEFLSGIKLEEVNQLAKQWITDKNMVVLIMTTEKEGLKTPTKEEVKASINKIKNAQLTAWVDKVSTRPLFEDKKLITKTGKVKKASKIKEFGAEKWVLDNGITVILKPTNFKDDEIKMTAYSYGGYSVYGQEDDMSAKFACDIIEESGLNGFDNNELNKKLSDKTVSVSPYIRELSEGFDGSSSVKDFDILLQLTHLYFVKPRYDKTAFSSFMSRMKSQLENKSLSPESAFQDSMRAVLTSHNKRSRPLSAKMLDEINYKRVHKIYRERFEDPSSFTFVFVGNINLEKAKPLIEKYLGSLPNIKKEEQWKDLNINYPKGKIDKKVVAGTEPKSIVLMQINHDFDYNQKDRLAIKTLGTILSIDLIEEVREKMSVVYTIGAYPNYDKLPTPSIQMTVYFPCAPENIEPATNKTLEIFKKISTEGPSDVNLEKARQQLLKARETNLRENRYWLSTIKNYNFYNIPFKEFGKTESIIKKINKDDIKATAKKYLNTDNYTRVYLVPKEKK